MAITLTEVKSPAGDVNGAVWFPALVSGDVDALLTGFIADAVTKTDDAAAQELWVYYRAATEVADRLMATPTTVSKSFADQGSKSQSMLATQITYWAEKAAAYLAAYTDAVAVVVDDPLGGFSVLTSMRHG